MKIPQLLINVFIAAGLTATSAVANDALPAVARQAETLPDGNVLDPEPTLAELKNLVARTQINMVAIKGGTFEMGDWGHEVNEQGLAFDGSPDLKPLHKVTLSSFSIGKYPVTYSEFDIFTAALRLPRISQGDILERYRKPDNPAGVTWQGAKDYCKWLEKQTGLAYDLPTEAQWEYAARSGGRRVLYPTDNGESEPGRNLPSYEQRKAAGGLVTVTSFPPNPAGIYYMSAGVSEWVNDWYDRDYYATSPILNPKGPANGIKHVMRGFAGSDSSAMTIKRWKNFADGITGTWTLYGKNRDDPKREIPYTKYTNYSDNAFRCTLNESQ